MKQIVEAGETKRVKVREILGLSALMNKAGCQTYLSKDEKSLISASYYIEAVHVIHLTMYCN